MITQDDVRRELEALGFTRGVDRTELVELARNAYSEIWEPSKKLQKDHETALAHSLTVVLGFLRAEAEQETVEAHTTRCRCLDLSHHKGGTR